MENKRKKKLLLASIFIFTFLVSMIIYSFVKADDIGKNKLKVKIASVSSIKTGTENFDSCDGLSSNSAISDYISGNDSSSLNRIVRSFDTITYDFDFKIESKEEGEDYSDRIVNIEVELTPLEAKYVVFNQNDNPDNTKCTYEFDGIDTLGTYRKSITLYVLGAPNGMEINPKFVIKEHTDEEAGVFLGKVSSTVNYYNYEDGEYTEEASFENIMPTIVSSKKAVLKFDIISNGNQKGKLNNQIGRYMTFVSGLYIEGGNNGLKGLDMPSGDYKFNVSFNQDGNGSVILDENSSKFFDNNGENIPIPFSKEEDSNNTIKNYGKMIVNKNNNSYEVVVSDYIINNEFPILNANGYQIDNKYYLGSYIFTVFSPRLSSDLKNNIFVEAVLNNFDIKNSSSENYDIEEVRTLNLNSYYEENDYSYDSNFYLEDDTKINNDNKIGSLSKGSTFIYKTTFDYNNSMSSEGLKEVIKINPNAFRLLDYDKKENKIVDIDLKCDGKECDSITKDDFVVKLVSGNFKNTNYSISEINPKIDSEDIEEFRTKCANLDLSSYTSDQIMNLYGGPCIKANDGVEEIYSSLDDAINANGKEIKITKVIIETKEGVSLPDNITVNIKLKLRVRNVSDLTRTYQVSSVVSTSSSDEVFHYYIDYDALTNPDNYRIPIIYGYEVDEIDDVNYIDALRITNYTSRQEISVLNKTSDGNTKLSFNTKDNDDINFSIKPIIEDYIEEVGGDDTWFIEGINIQVYLPNTLIFIPSVEDKYLEDITETNYGTYLYYFIPFSKTNFVIDSINFKAKINSNTLLQDSDIEIRSTLYAVNVNNEEDNNLFNRSEDTFTIHGIASLNVIPMLEPSDRGVSVEKNTEFSYLLSIFNNTNKKVDNYKIIDILPFNDDINESKIDGTYKVKLNVPSSLENIKVFCSKNRYDKLKESNYEWEECDDITNEYKEITAFKISNISLEAHQTLDKIELIINPNNNDYSNKYNNNFFIESNSKNRIKSNTISIGVVNRSISGKVFKDINENGIQDSGDKYISSIPVSLYKINKEDSVLVSESITDNDGKYVFNNLDTGSYYIDLSYNGNEYDLTRRYASMDEKIDSDAYKVSSEIARISNKKTPDEAFGIKLTNEDISIKNLDMGLIPRRMFGFDIKKYITKIDLSYNGNKEVLHYNNESKVSLNIRNSLRANAKVYYGIAITNNSSRPGYVNKIEESIPDGLIFDQNLEENKEWIILNGKVISTSLSDIIIYPGETKYLEIVLYLPERESAGIFINTVSILEMNEYIEKTLSEEEKYVNENNYVIGESVNYAGFSWHVIDVNGKDITLLADSSSIEGSYSHLDSSNEVYKWSTSNINNILNNMLMSSLDKTVLYDTSICDDASGLEVASFGGSISGACQSGIYTKSKIRLLTSEEYTRIVTSSLSNIDWLIGYNDYWLQSSDDTRPIYQSLGIDDSNGEMIDSTYNKALYVSSTGIKSDYINSRKEIRPVITISSNNILFD